MKKTIAILLFSVIIISQSCTPSSFATVGNNGWKVTLYHYTSEVKLEENGQECTLVKAFAGHKKAGYAAASSGLGASGGYDYYTNGIQLDKSTETHQIKLTQGSKTATVTIDRKSKPFIDVTAALNESKTMSFDDLQKEFIKQQSKKKREKI